MKIHPQLSSVIQNNQQTDENNIFLAEVMTIEQ